MIGTIDLLDSLTHWLILWSRRAAAIIILTTQQIHSSYGNKYSMHGCFVLDRSLCFAFCMYNM